MHEFEALENAAVSALTPLLAGGLKTLDAYAGQLDIDDLNQVTFQFPCIYAMAAGLELKEVNRYDAFEMGLLLIVGDRNLRGSKAAARGDAASPGVYQLLVMARAGIHQKKILEKWSPLVLQREVPLVYAANLNICLYQAEYRTKRMK